MLLIGKPCFGFCLLWPSLSHQFSDRPARQWDIRRFESWFNGQQGIGVSRKISKNWWSDWIILHGSNFGVTGRVECLFKWKAARHTRSPIIFPIKFAYTQIFTFATYGRRGEVSIARFYFFKTTNFPVRAGAETWNFVFPIWKLRLRESSTC